MSPAVRAKGRCSSKRINFPPDDVVGLWDGNELCDALANQAHKRHTKPLNGAVAPIMIKPSSTSHSLAKPLRIQLQMGLKNTLQILNVGLNTMAKYRRSPRKELAKQFF
ncbi:hypothetical protein [Brucella anthropi]|uniref:hypothetical protein n=1 Tax=Brucella anthropi TaxID=529 RepID=UPI0021586879|nr:hypothetical protein [Brucella anthropi]MCR8489141.1 hypothetical protein [Brucella anthropi]